MSTWNCEGVTSHRCPLNRIRQVTVEHNRDAYGFMMVVRP